MTLSFIKKTSRGISLFLKIIPNGSKNELLGVENEELKMRVHALPDKGKANQMVLEFLSEVLKHPKTKLKVIRGETSRHKVVLVEDLEESIVIERFLEVLKSVF